MKIQPIYIVMKKKIKKRSFEPIIQILSILLVGAIISYVTFVDLKMLVINLIVFSIFAYFYIERSVKASGIETTKLIMLTFIDQYIASLSVHKTVLAAFNNTLEVSDVRIKNELMSFTEVDPLEKIEFLASIFTANIYQSFIKNVKTYNEIGGDILLSSSFLLKEIAEERTLIMKNRQLTSQTLIELLTGWFFVFLIVLMLKFAVTDIYHQLLMNPIFSYGLEAFILLILVSVFMHKYVTSQMYLEKKVKRQKKVKYISINDFVESFSYFRINLSSGTNVYKSLEMTAMQSQGEIGQELYHLINEIKVRQNVTPFIDFSARFNDPLVKHIMINIYQMMINGGDSSLLFEFNHLFDRIYETNASLNYQHLKQSYENINQMPMLGSGVLVILIMAGVIGLLGTMLYV